MCLEENGSSWAFVLNTLAAGAAGVGADDDDPGYRDLDWSQWSGAAQQNRRLMSSSTMMPAAAHDVDA